jgi:orotate phosphoribosyltransferase
MSNTHAMPLTSDEVEGIFRNADALLDGHFVLSSGMHSTRYLEKFRVFERPQLTQRLCAGIIERLPLRVDVVAGPSTGGMLLAQEVARQLGTLAVYAEREEGRSGRFFRRGQRLLPGEHVLVVDDVLTTGISLRETVAAVRAAGATVVAAAVLVDRSGGVDLGVPLLALWTTPIDAVDPSNCPSCARGDPLTKPGTAPAVSTPSTR